jgi:hypothetical protein
LAGARILLLRPGIGRLLAGCLLLPGAASCFNAVDAPSAYDGEHDLCSDEFAEEYADRVEACRKRWRKDKSCGGVVSFSGTLQGVEVVVDAELEGTEIRDIQIDGVNYRDRLRLAGMSPYFEFELAAKLLGGDTGRTLTDRELVVNPAVDRESTWFEDARTDLELGLQAGTLSDVQLTSGSFVLEEQNADVSRGHFAGRSADELTDLRGCFHAFTTESLLELGEP